MTMRPATYANAPELLAPLALFETELLVFVSVDGERFRNVGMESVRGDRSAADIRKSYNPGKNRRVVVRPGDCDDARRYRSGWEIGSNIRETEPLDAHPAWLLGFRTVRQCMSREPAYHGMRTHTEPRML